MKLELLYEGVEPGSCRNWNYRIEDLDGNVHYCGRTTNPRLRRMGHMSRRSKRKMPYVSIRMHERGLENFVMVVHDGDNEKSKERCGIREIDYMHKWRTIKSQYPGNPHACNILSKMGMDIESDLSPEARKEMSRKISESLRKKYAAHVDAWAFHQVYHVAPAQGLTRREMAAKLGTTYGYLAVCAKRHMKSSGIKKPPINLVRVKNMRAKRFTDEQEDRMHDLNYNHGVSIPTLAREFECSIGTVAHSLRRSMDRRGIPFENRAKKALTDRQEDFAFDQVYGHGKTKTAMAKKYGVKRGVIDCAFARVAERRGIDHADLPDLRLAA